MTDDVMKKRYRLAIRATEDEKILYIIYDSTKDIAQQLLAGKIKYYSNRRKAEAECKRLNIVMAQVDEIFNEREAQKKKP